MKNAPIDLTLNRERNFRAVCDMETPLVVIGDLLRMIEIACQVSDLFGDDQDASAIQRTVWLAIQQMKEVERLRGSLFNWNHANPEMIEKGAVL